MTIDKIKHYIGEQVFQHISNLDAPNLQAMKTAIIQDMNAVKLPSDILFKRTIELKYINIRLND